jgi:hypothetical protein
MKCRDSPLRALATTLLKEQGREWPTDGQIMAVLGARLAAFESSASVPTSPGTPLAACDILEGQRIHGYGVPSLRLNREGRRVVDAVFSRPLVPPVQGWGYIDYECLDYWIFWSEPIDI